MTRCAYLAALLLTIQATLSAPALSAAPVFTAGAITVEQPWSRATPGGAMVAGGYMTIRNGGDGPDRLVSASTEAAGRVGPHSMTMTGGVMQMRPLPGGIPVPPHGSVVLSPSGDHLMLEDLKHPFKAGEHFAGTLVFEHAGTIAVTFSIEAIGAKAPAGAPGADGGAMKGMKMN